MKGLRGGASNFRNLKETDPDALRELVAEAIRARRERGTSYTFTASERHRGGVIRGAQRTLARLARERPVVP